MMPITQKGYDELTSKLEKIKAEFEKMPAIIGEAREKGDLKENAEYHAAKERQGMLKANMNKLTSELVNSQVIEPKNLPADTITFGKIVQVKEQISDKKFKYIIVGPAESNIQENKISIQSQVAKGLLGKKKGDSVSIKLPVGEKKFSILSINYY